MATYVCLGEAESEVAERGESREGREIEQGETGMSRAMAGRRHSRAREMGGAVQRWRGAPTAGNVTWRSSRVGASAVGGSALPLLILGAVVWWCTVAMASLSSGAQGSVTCAATSAWCARP